MIRSIRAFLIFYIGIAVFFTMFLITSSMSYYLDRMDIQQHLDSFMAITALSLNATLEDLNENEIQELQNKFNEIPDLFQKIHHSHLFSAKQYAKSFIVQLLDHQGDVIIQTKNKVQFPPTIVQQRGFHNLKLNDHEWRIYVTENKHLGIYLLLAEPSQIRGLWTKKIILEDLLMIFSVFPLLGIVIWISINKSLKPLKEISSALRGKNSLHLEPLRFKKVPEEIKPLLDEINGLLTRVKEAISREQEFAGNAAHDIRTPLAIIKTLAQSSLNSESIIEIHLQLQKIIANVDRGSHVVSQLMNMSKTLPETLYKNDFELLNLNDVVQDSLVNLVYKALEKNIDLELDTVDNPCQIRGNRIALDILTTNLVDNAIRYSPEGSKVFINVYTTEEHVILEVRDEGPGIPKIKQNKIFERFYRLHPTQFQGTGLGLAIVKQIANVHDAEISLETPKNRRGVIFRVFFKRR
jgi:two-component system sensor histidine kinase QseC